jgi:hypothetical protein
MAGGRRIRLDLTRCQAEALLEVALEGIGDLDARIGAESAEPGAALKARKADEATAALGRALSGK